MQYFVSIENNFYCNWQIELLIESFKILKLENELVVAIACDQRSPISHGYKNLSALNHKFFHPNYGLKKRNKRLNKFYGLYTAIQNNILKQPFALLHSDMILVNPLKPFEANLTFHHDSNNQDEFTDSIKSKLGKMPWLSMGDSMVFQDVPLTFFQEVMQMMLHLKSCATQPRHEEACWMLGLCNHSSLTLNPILMESNLLDHEIRDIIHYKHGYPPFFNKKHYVTDGFLLSEHPYDVLMRHNPSPASNILQNIVRRYKGA